MYCDPRMKLPSVKKDAGYYLRVWRAERNLAMFEAAEYFGIGPSHLSLIESGHRNASPKHAVKMAKATKAPVELFLGIAVTR